MDDVILDADEEQQESAFKDFVFLNQMGITDFEIQTRLQLSQLTQEDFENISIADNLMQKHAGEVIDSLYDFLTQIDEFRAFFFDKTALANYKKLQKEFFTLLTKGPFDKRYFENRLKFDFRRANMGLEVRWFLSAYNFYLRKISACLVREHSQNMEKTHQVIASLTKLAFMDLALAVETYIYQRQETIQLQQESIRAVSTPVLQLREELLILPIIGAIDPLRARQLTEQLLYAIRDRRAKVAVMDITGVPTVDSRVANHLMQTVDAARLMGATVIVTGLSAEVAQTLVTIGVDLSKINTVGDLQGGIDQADKIIAAKGPKKKKSITEPREMYHSGLQESDN